MLVVFVVVVVVVVVVVAGSLLRFYAGRVATQVLCRRVVVVLIWGCYFRHVVGGLSIWGCYFRHIVG